MSHVAILSFCAVLCYCVKVTCMLYLPCTVPFSAGNITGFEVLRVVMLKIPTLEL